MPTSTDIIEETLSLQPEVYLIGAENARRRAESFSAYVAWLIQRDTEARNGHGNLIPSAPEG